MEITINQNENQLIRIGNSNIQDINITEDENQEIGINNITPQSLNVNQPETQTILIDGGGAVIGITDVLVNGITVVSGNIAYITVPTKTSELINNSGFITSETDPTVPTIVKQITLADINNWNNKQNELISGSNIKTINNNSLLGSGNLTISGTQYTAGNGISIENDIITNTVTSYNALSDLPTIPTKTSDLINDNEYVSIDELAEVAFTGSYANLNDTPTIPAFTSELTNDSNFVSNTDYATNQSGGVIIVNGFGLAVASNGTLRGNAMTYANYLNTNNNSVVAKNTLENVITGKGLINKDVNNLTNYMLTNDINTALSSKQDNLTSGTGINITNNVISNTITKTSDLTNDSNFAQTNVNNNFTTNQTINGFITATNISNCIIKGISSSAIANITSTNGYGNIYIFSILYISMIQFQGTNTNPLVIDIYGTHTFNTNMNNNTLELTNLNSWDHYIIIGTETIENITI